MLATLIRAMEAQRAPLGDRWEALLRAESPSSPLANPEILVFKIPETCDEILEYLGKCSEEGCEEVAEPECSCGLNPLLVFFAAGGRALEEAMLRAIRTVPHLTMADQTHAMSVLHLALRGVRAREIAVLCSLCRLRHTESETCATYSALSTRSR